LIHEKETLKHGLKIAIGIDHSF